MKSFGRGQSIDKENNPLPWFNYSCIRFLEERINGGMHIFEYGCGNSSIWLAQRAERFVAVEHSAPWANKIRTELASNGEIILCAERDKYVTEPKLHQPFDIIVIDGLYRNECCNHAAQALTAKGIIILDDSERQDYTEGIASLRKLGFKEMPFWGAKPCALAPARTSIFYRQDNALNI